MASTARQRSGIKPKDNLATVRIHGEEIVVDAATLTMAEKQAGRKALHGLGYPPDDDDRFMAVLWVVMRRSNPKLSFDELCESITEADVEAVEEPEDVDSPEG
jgi:hypothetical protein